MQSIVYKVSIIFFDVLVAVVTLGRAHVMSSNLFVEVDRDSADAPVENLTMTVETAGD